MIREILQPKEKKVEYIELIYDLIFVYIIGRNNQLFLKAGAISAVFITLMLLFRENMMINIFVTVAFVFVLFLIIYRYGKRINRVSFETENQ